MSFGSNVAAGRAPKKDMVGRWVVGRAKDESEEGKWDKEVKWRSWSQGKRVSKQVQVEKDTVGQQNRLGQYNKCPSSYTR